MRWPIIAALVLCVFLMGAGPLSHSLGDGDMRGDPALRHIGGSGYGKLWNGHDFVFTMAIDNAGLVNTSSLIRFFTDSIPGTMDIDVSKVYADSASTPAGTGVYETAQNLSNYFLDGHNISPQGIHKPRWSGDGEPWNKGYASWTDEDSIQIDLDRDWLATHLTVDASELKSLSYPYGYMNGTVYQKAQDEGYSWGRTFRGELWAFLGVDGGWKTGYADPPKIIPPSIGNDDVFNIYGIGSADSLSAVLSYADTLTYAQVIANVENFLVQPAIASRTFNLAYVFHEEPNLHRVKWMLNYLNDTYDVWFTDFTTMMEWWAPRNAIYPRNPPHDAKGSILAGTVAADSVFWGKSPEPTINHGYVFSNSSTATLDTLDIGGHAFPATNCYYMEVRANAATTAYPSGGYLTFTTGQFPLDGSDRIGALYFGCAATLSGKKIAKAYLHWITDYAPNATTYGPPDGTAKEFLHITSATDANFAQWVQYGSAAASFNNMNQAGAVAWPSALGTYAQPESLGIVSYQWDTFDVGTWEVTDVTHGVQAWADGSPEGGFIFSGRRPSSISVFSVRHHGHSTVQTRPYLVVYTED